LISRGVLRLQIFREVTAQAKPKRKPLWLFALVRTRNIVSAPI